MTNLSIPASCPAIKTCSSNGFPLKDTRGFGREPAISLIREPFPAARITAILVHGISHLGLRWQYFLRRRVIAIRNVARINDIDVGRAKNSRFGDAVGRDWKPEFAALLVALHEMHALCPERRIVSGLALSARQSEIAGVHPDTAFHQVFVPALGNDIDDISRAAVEHFRSHHAEVVVVGSQAGLRTCSRTRSFTL